jgi:hypothetical protein
MPLLPRWRISGLRQARDTFGATEKAAPPRETTSSGALSGASQTVGKRASPLRYRRHRKSEPFVFWVVGCSTAGRVGATVSSLGGAGGATAREGGEPNSLRGSGPVSTQVILER